MQLRDSGVWAIPEPHILLAADLVTLGSPIDGLTHLLDEQAYADAMAASDEGRVNAPRFEALCRYVLIPDSLVADPRPVCSGCSRQAGPRLNAARERAACQAVPSPRCPHPVQASWTRVASVGAAALARLCGGDQAARSHYPASQFALSDPASIGAVDRAGAL